MDSFDLLIVGGGINGAAIARDASMRGMSVLLVEKDDLAAHTSSASSKLVHGGLRYLEYRAFRLVRESLREREILLRTAPHIVRPLRFLLPHGNGMRPRWLIRSGLLLYDLFALRGGLPRSRRLGRRERALAEPLREPGRPYAYWDARVDDSRLAVLNAVAAAEQGAEIATRTELLGAVRSGTVWHASLSGGRRVSAGALVNAAGPWADSLLGRLGAGATSRLRLVRGSHVVLPALWPGDHAFILQQPDGRVVFALPFAGRTLVGTTDKPVARPEEARIDEDEVRYLCEAVNRYFDRPVIPADVLWSYSGVRALYDDGASDAQAVSRDYRLELEEAGGARLLSVFGGKITTARALAAEALERLGIKGRCTTDSVSLPGGDIVPAFLDWLEGAAEWIPQPMLARLSSAYGTRLLEIIGDATRLSDLGRHYGGGLYEAELRYLATREFARSGDDILWRRTKLGLELTPAEQRAVAKRMENLR